MLMWLSKYLHCLYVISEMVMQLGIVIEQVNENGFVIDEAAYNEGVREPINCHCVIIDIKQLINLQFCWYNLIWGSLVTFRRVFGCVESSNLEIPIIIICQSKLISSRILLNLLHFDIVSFAISNLFFECFIVRF